MLLKDADEIAISVDPHQSDLGLHCFFLWQVFPFKRMQKKGNQLTRSFIDAVHLKHTTI